MKQKITVLLEVIFLIQWSSINGDILDGTSLYFTDNIWIQWSSINSEIPDGTWLYLNQIFLIFRNGFRLSYFFGDNFGQFGWFDQKWRNPASFVRRARLIVLLVFS